MAKKHTERGFAIYAEFTDLYGSQVRVQESSTGGGDRVWIFADNKAEPDIDSPHLSVEQAIIVRDALDEFINDAKSYADIE